MNNLGKKTLIFVLLMAAVASAGWFGRKLYKKYTVGHLVVQARQYINKKDQQNAAICLQRALQIDPMNAASSETLADFLEIQGLPATLSWRIRAAQLAPDKPEYRLAWARTAIQLHEFASAKAALDSLNSKRFETAEFHKLEGALAWALN